VVVQGVPKGRRTAANHSGWPVERAETLRALLRGDKPVRAGGGGIVERSGSGAQWCTALAFAALALSVVGDASTFGVDRPARRRVPGPDAGAG
jgi:hypothetical protein